MDIDTSRYREGLPQIGVQPYRQVHAHSTGNKHSTAQNEADYHMRRPVDSGFFSHVVGNGRVMQVGPVNQGAYDVGGGWNAETYAAVELIESHETLEEFLTDYRLYIELLRNLADEAGLPKTLDSDELEGIKTHYYCTYNQPNNQSDHVDPYPYLASWGIGREQFKNDIENGIEQEIGWVQSANGWQYRDENGLVKNDWKQVEDKWYRFDSSGYIICNDWFKNPANEKWYWLHPDGVMATGWQLINDKWYFFNEDGEMVEGWLQYKDKIYYLKANDGDMVSRECRQIDGAWYYFNDNGERLEKANIVVDENGKIHF